MNLLYRFHWDLGRGGDIEGIFVADDAAVAAAIGKRVYLGEANGKYSEVFGDLDKEDLTILTDDQSFIERFQQYLPRGSGYNPLQYLSEDL